VGAIGRACVGGVILVVDASLHWASGLDVVRDSVDICYSSATSACTRARACRSVWRHVWPRIESIPPRVYYLDLRRYRRY